MDTPTPGVHHALSGLNPTLFNVVVQYADMDMLRALVLTSPSLYGALQQCQFDHLSMVVLEAPILDDLQQVVYNGADPVPADTFEFPPNDIVSTLLMETPPSKASSSRPGPVPPSFVDWQQAFVSNDYYQNLPIPDYARNFMARAQSVELVVYRRRLGTRISTFFTTNEHDLKHGRSTTSDECTSCVESNKSASATVRPKLHLPCYPTPHAQHCNPNDEHVLGDGDNGTTCLSNNGCIFSKHRSRECFEDEGVDSRRFRFHTTANDPLYFSQQFPYEELPPLQLRFPRHTTDAISSKFSKMAASHSTHKRVKHRRNKRCKRGTDNTFYRDGHFYIAADRWNTYPFHPRFQNLPLVEQHAPMTSLKIHIVDYVCFGVEDWCNAIPGCTIQPVQTWVIRADESTPHPIHQIDATPWPMYGRYSSNIGHYLPHLTNLVLQYSRLDDTNRCGIDDFIMPDLNELAHSFELSQFFIDDDDVTRLPHLQHFDVTGILLTGRQYSQIIFSNARITSLGINPGPQPIKHYSSPTIIWICALLGHLADLELEDSDTLSSSTISDDELKQEDIATNSAIRHESIQQLETTPRPRRKYNFSFDFASPYLGSCCPHNVDILTQKALANTHIDAHTDTSSDDISSDDTSSDGTPPDDISSDATPSDYTSADDIPSDATPSDYTSADDISSDDISSDEDLSQFAQHLTTCASIRNSLTCFHQIHGEGSGINYETLLSEEVPSRWVFANDGRAEFLPVVAIARLAQRTLTRLELRCHYCSHANPGSIMFPGARPGDCTATHLPPSTNTPLSTADLPQDEDALTRVRSTRPSKEMYVRLRELLRIPEHVVLRL